MSVGEGIKIRNKWNKFLGQHHRYIISNNMEMDSVIPIR